MESAPSALGCKGKARGMRKFECGMRNGLWGRLRTRNQAFLSRRPEQGAAGEEVDVEVGDGFAAGAAVVDDEAEALRGRIDAEIGRDFGGGEEEVAEDGLIFGAGFTDPGNQLLRDDEQMDGSLRIDVPEDDAMAVVVEDVRRDFAGDDPLENGHGGEFRRPSRRCGQTFRDR